MVVLFLFFDNLPFWALRTRFSLKIWAALWTLGDFLALKGLRSLPKRS